MGLKLESRRLKLFQVSSDDEEGGNPMVARYDDMVYQDFQTFPTIQIILSRLTSAVMPGSMGLPWWQLKMIHQMRRMTNQ